MGSPVAEQQSLRYFQRSKTMIFSYMFASFFVGAISGWLACQTFKKRTDAAITTAIDEAKAAVEAAKSDLPKV